MSRHVLKVDAQSNQLRLDIYLTKKLPEAPSRTFIQKLITSGHVLVNKKSTKAHEKVYEDDEVSVEIPLPRDDGIPPEDFPLDIFYEDEDILVVNKPSGLLVHPTNAVNVHGTLVNALLHHCRKLSALNEETRPGIVHRLDRETSGLMVVAKDHKAHAQLARQFEQHRVKKRYLALVEGEIEFEEGIIDAALGRHPRYYDRKKVSFEAQAKESTTMYRVLKRKEGRTLVALYPKTGRTHQLRVHMAHLGHPILGDAKYGRKNSFSRLALHAQSLGFFHPRSGGYVEFSTRIPKEFLSEEIPRS